MRLSPILGLPIAEQDDARREYPMTVDDPRTTALESVRLACSVDVPEQGPLATGAYNTLLFGTAWPHNTGLFTPSASGIVVNNTGYYSLSTGLVFSNDGTNVQICAGLDGVAMEMSAILGGAVPGQTMTSGHAHIEANAGQTLTLKLWTDTAMASIWGGTFSVRWEGI